MRGADVGKDTVRYAIGKGTAAIAMVASIPLATRNLGATDYAVFALWLSVSVWVAAGCVGWLQASVLRFYRELSDGSGASEIEGSFVVALLIVAVVAAVITFEVISIAASGDRFAWEFALVAFAHVVSAGGMATAQAELRAWVVSLAEIARAVTLVAMLACLVSLDWCSIRSVAVSHGLAMMTSAVITLTALSRRGIAIRRASGALIARFLWFGVPVTVWLLVTHAGSMLGRPLLHYSGQLGELAAYASVQDLLVKGGTLLFMPFTYAVHTNAMASWAEGHWDGTRIMLGRAFLWLCAAGGVFVLGAATVGPLVTGLLFPDGEAVSRTNPSLLSMLALAVVLGNAALLAHKGLEISQRTEIMALLAFGGLLANGAAALVLVPALGAVGAAAALCIGQGLYMACALSMSRRRLLVLTEARFASGSGSGHRRLD